VTTAHHPVRGAPGVVEVFADIWCPYAHVGIRRFVHRRWAAHRNDLVLRVRAWPLQLVNGEPLDADHVVLQSNAADGTLSRIRATLTPGSVVTTLKNTVDHIVTEYGVAEMRGRSISERARALIAIADPRFRDELTREATALSYL
jgi:Acetyl-CoA hydrolase/transferase C-terminal domain